MFREGSEHVPTHTSDDTYEGSLTEVAPGVFDASSLVEQELAKDDPLFAETLKEIEKAEDPALRTLLEKVKDRMLNEYVDSKYKVTDGERPTYH